MIKTIYYKKNIIEKKLSDLGAVFTEMSDSEIISKTARVIADNNAVGWFQGRMEFGPRALGNRSIIADPRSENMQKNLNLKVKFRESFRPFAPSILIEELKNYFDMETPSPYMLLVANIKDNLKIQMTDSQKRLFGIEKLNIKRFCKRALRVCPAVTWLTVYRRLTVCEKISW